MCFIILIEIKNVFWSFYDIEDDLTAPESRSVRSTCIYRT